jgi:23S rRNA (guanosine2251-2'-O)-methyltransferase
MIIFGINPVFEALRAGRVDAIRFAHRGDARLSLLLDAARKAGVTVKRVDADELERASHGGVHQGVVALLHDPEAIGVDDLVASASGAPLVVVLDGVEDPQNLGAILRSVDAAGAHGVVRQMRHAAPLGGAAAKASAGAVAHVKVADVVNIARTLETLKQAGVWTVGLAVDASKPYDAIDFTLPTAIVVGGEGSGLRRLVRERCDWLVSVPMKGHVQSLNVAVATGVVLFEAMRQRRNSRGAAT